METSRYVRDLGWPLASSQQENETLGIPIHKKMSLQHLQKLRTGSFPRELSTEATAQAGRSAFKGRTLSPLPGKGASAYG